MAGREVAVSSLDRVLFPRTGTTKAAVIDYYVQVAAVLLAHVADRPVTLHRFPEGVGGPHFFQTRTPPHPPWVRTVTMSFPRTGKTFDAPVLDDLPSLVWAGNLSTIEIHPFLNRTRDPARPTALVVDLDPGPPADLLDAAAVALRARDALGGPSWAKTSGGKGMHVYARSDGLSYAETKRRARDLARALAAEDPRGVTDRMVRAERPGRVFVDWSQNDAGKSTVAAYSLRALATPTVSTPVTWNEVETAVAEQDARRLVFSPAATLERVARLGDLFAALA